MTYNQGYTAKQHSVSVKRYCQTLNLKNNPALIAEYRKIHSKKEAWPEIRKGIRSVGILEMEIYISGFQVFMIIETPLDFDWETAMNTLSHLPKLNGKSMYQNSKNVLLRALLLKNGN